MNNKRIAIIETWGKMVCTLCPLLSVSCWYVQLKYVHISVCDFRNFFKLYQFLKL